MTRLALAAKPPTAGWDIHCHTVYSDGTETPETLVEMSRGLGLHGASISDHDTTSGWNDATSAAKAAGMHLLRGTEITACDGDVSVHMLAFQYDPADHHTADLFALTRQARLKRTKAMVARLSADFPISWQSVLDQVHEGEKTTVGRPHIADALVAAGVYRTRSEAFADAVSASSKYYIPTPSPTTHEVLAAVRAAGGVVIIAHPGAVSRNRTLLSDDQISALAAEGLDGLEIWHRDNPPEQRERLLALAHEHDLLVTGGSDWHGGGKPNRLGENLTDDETVDEIVRRGSIGLV